jgi:hypothetical protein
LFAAHWTKIAAAQGDLQRVIAIDWSGRIDAAGQRRHIWAGVWTAAGAGKKTKESFALEAGRTRQELAAWLIELAQETPRMVVGVDCCFSYPAWFLKEHKCRTVFELWKKVAEGKGEEWLHRDCADDRFWGKAGSLRHGRRPEEFCGPGLMRMMRFTDVDNKITPKLLEEEPERAAAVLGITPKSPFQIGGAGSVGTGSLRAMPMLLKLREAGFRTWPFEAAELGAEEPKPLLVEMYTRLLTGAVKKSNAEARKVYLAERRMTDAAFAGISRKVLTAAEGSEDAFDALVCAVEMVRRRGEFPGLKATEDQTLRLEGITWRPGVSSSTP